MKYAFIGRAILAGALLGAALYFAPFLFFPLRIIAGILFFGFIIRLLFFGGRRGWRHHGPGWGGGPGWRGRGNGFNFMDRVRNMTPEEYQAFKTRAAGWGRGCGHGPGYNQEPAQQAPTQTTTV